MALADIDLKAREDKRKLYQEPKGYTDRMNLEKKVFIRCWMKVFKSVNSL